MNKTKDKFRKAFDCLISKDEKTAKAIIKEAISQHPKMKKYKTALSEMGLDYGQGGNAYVENKTYDDIHEILKEFQVPIKLKILDVCYKEIATEEK